MALVMAGAVSRAKHEHDGRAWLAWHVAALMRVKRLPKLEKMQHGRARPVRRQSVAEMIAVAQAWTAALAR